jgi:thymidine phosphorylase
MSPGTLFLVVGASGVGKDTLLNGARARLGPECRFVFARRVITRPAEFGGEEHEPVTNEEFVRRKEAGHFLFTWDAHGFSYGLPNIIVQELKAGRNVVANGSRATIPELVKILANLVVIEVVAPAAMIQARIEGRGRENANEIEQRLCRDTPPLPCDVLTVQIVNDRDIDTGVQRLIAALSKGAEGYLRLKAMPLDSGRDHLIYLPARSTLVNAPTFLDAGFVEVYGAGHSVRGSINLVEDDHTLAPTELGLSRSAFQALGLPEGTNVGLRRMTPPDSSISLQRKLRGEELDESQTRQLIRDIVEGRYPEREVSAFLVAATRGLTDDEVAALARARFELAEKITWDEKIVVDKHSIGGIPGSRITMILVPLVAAFGLAMPKASSRAITSAAGTADAMETVARVDLSISEVRQVVAQARGCVVWNGRLNHSVVDDVMNAITRPLGLESSRWAVASILSKKLAAGSTHVIIDLPHGPQAKLKSLRDAEQLAELFHRVGRKLGIHVEAYATDGSTPIGRGIGPALELRDVMAVLENDPEAPTDLREKALLFASRILAWDHAIGSEQSARIAAEKLLSTGQARAAFDRIIDAQGRRAPAVLPSVCSVAVKADRSGIVTAIDTWKIAGIARAAGAPNDLSAGVQLLRRPGAAVQEGDDLYLIYGNSENTAGALSIARWTSGYVIS